MNPPYNTGPLSVIRGTGANNGAARMCSTPPLGVDWPCAVVRAAHADKALGAAGSAIYDLQWLAFTMLGRPCSAWARASAWPGFFAHADQRDTGQLSFINEGFWMR